MKGEIEERVAREEDKINGDDTKAQYEVNYIRQLEVTETYKVRFQSQFK